MQTQLINLPIDSLIKADWNYKTDGTEEQIAKLAEAIKMAGSAGVFAVRELNNKFEVMDGNHRLEAVKRLGWNEVPCENFGKLKKSKAVIITRQRNQNWFDDDKLKLAKLFVDEVFGEFDKTYLATILPETLESLETLELVAIADWSQPELEKTDGDQQRYKKLIFEVPEDTFNLWQKWKDRLQELTEIDSDARAFEFAVIEALNVPEQKWTQKS